MAKTLLIENSDFISQITVDKALTESISVSNGKNNTLIVKNVPCTILNRTNQNGRIYSTEEMQKAINEAKPLIARKQLLSQASEHPEGSFVSPTHASHVVTNAYIKKNVKLEVEGENGTWDVLFMDWEVLNTQEGQNLQALLLSECSLGTSIRGLGDMQGDKVVNYELLGVDVVSNPSSGTFTRMPVSESVKLESVDKNALDEATRYTISTYASNTTHDLQQAIEFQNNAATNLQYGTITNVGTKMDQEVDPDTGVEKIVGEVEVETSDDTSELQTAINAAVKAFTNPNNINVTSVTIEKVDDDDIKDSVEDEAEQPLEEKQTAQEENISVDDGSTDVTSDGLVESPETEELDKAFMNGEISFEEYQQKLQDQQDKEDEEQAAIDQEREQQRQARKNAQQVASDQPQETLRDVWSKTYKNEELDYQLDSGYHVKIVPSDQESISMTIMGPAITVPYDSTKDLVEQLKTALSDLINKNFSLEDKPVVDSFEGNFSEETMTEDNDIQVQNNKVITTIDGEKYEKDFQDKTQAQLAASGVAQGKLQPSTVLPDEYDSDNDDYDIIVDSIDESLNELSEDDPVDVATLEKLLKQYTKEGNPSMVAALAKAIEQTKAQQAPESSNEVSDNNEAFKVDELPQSNNSQDMKHIDQGDINVQNAVKLDSADTKEVVYTEPDQPSDKLVEPKDKKEEVVVELTDLSYDVDKDSDIQEGSDEEYDSVLEALQGLPETITITIDASTLSPDSDPLEAILQQANAQTGLPIKNAKIANIKDKEEN